MTTEKKDRVIEAKEYRQNMMDKLEVETSAAETFKPVNDKDTYIQTLEQKINKLKSMIDDMTEKSKNLEKDVRTEFEKESEKLNQRYRQAKVRLDEIRQSSGNAWKELHDSSLDAWRDLADGVKNAVSKFR